MKKSYVIVGLGRLGMAILKSLSKQTTNIIAIDNDESRVALANEFTEKCFVTDATKKRALVALGVKNIDQAIIAIGGDFSASILATINLKELGTKRITVRVDDEDQVDVIKMLGADDVLDPENDTGAAFAKQAMSDSILDYYPIDDNYAIVQISVPASFRKISLLDLDSRNRYDINIVGIIRNERFFIPKGSDMVEPGDILMSVGESKKLKKFDSIINR